jgi:hypothetical protein
MGKLRGVAFETQITRGYRRLPLIWSLKIGAWDLFGIWCLSFVI